MTTRRTITLRNNFHNTEAKAIALDGVISDRAMKRQSASCAVFPIALVARYAALRR